MHTRTQKNRSTISSTQPEHYSNSSEDQHRRSQRSDLKAMETSPKKDFDAILWDKSFYGKNRTHEAPHWFGNICYVGAAFLCKFVTRYHVKNRSVLRACKGKTGAVVVANHKSFLDLAFLYSAARPSQWIRFMARDNLFHGLGGHAISLLGAFPVKRDSADTASIRRAVRMLKNQELVGIFPEGTRRNRGSEKPEVHAGAALIARMGHAPMIPCTVRNVEKIKQPGQPFFHWPTCSVIFGQPLYVSWFDFLPRHDRLKAMTWYALRQCYAMDQDISPDKVNMKELFPDEHDFSDVFSDKIQTPDGFKSKND